MITEKNIPKLILLAPLVSIFLFSLVTTFIFVQNQYAYFEEESMQLEREYIQRQRAILARENNTVIAYMAHQEESMHKRAKKALAYRVKRVHNLAQDIFYSHDIQGLEAKKESFLKELSKERLKGKSYYFVLSKEGAFFIHSANKEAIKNFDLNQKSVREKFLKNFENNRFQTLGAQKLLFAKALDEFGWIVGSVESLEDELLQTKERVKAWIERIRYEDNGYIWVHNTQHVLVSHPFRKAEIGSDDTFAKDAAGELIFQRFIKVAKSHESGGFTEYYWQKPERNTPSKKLGFLQLYENWGWVVGSGLYMDDIENSIASKKALLEQKIERYMRIIILTTLSLMLFVGVLSFILSNYISTAFTDYKEKVEKKEKSLKELNLSLAHKIELAIKEAKKKDRALLHQSRLAQMGEMISMVAHQWRQPLSEVGGIFMELETAAKFQKADPAYIQACSKEGDALVAYMSHTIDDFRNFFKPDRIKETFCLNSACEDACSLAQAALKSARINLVKDFQQEVYVTGYARELAQVVFNLLSNARDALVEQNIQNPEISLCLHQEAHKAIIKIEDNARGIKEDVLERVFEPYFSTKKAQGTGLGLYMAKMIIEENMQGLITVENTQQGACFYIKLEASPKPHPDNL